MKLWQERERERERGEREREREKLKEKRGIPRQEDDSDDFHENSRGIYKYVSLFLDHWLLK